MLPAQVACAKPPNVKRRLLWPITTVWVCASHPPWKVLVLPVGHEQEWSLPRTVAEGQAVQSVEES